MPANRKYLTTSFWHKGTKIVSGILGGYIITALLHMIVALVLPFHKEILITSIFTMFIIWGTLLIIPFLFKNGFKSLLMYMLIIVLLFILYTLVQKENPFVS
ncbi:hypothetical protein [uncultured Tenacibaculum sp.]|uniref:hypothetical protein n=1 Tax=uncultured Tenacibaculum sp. TaxID=174713 RepID=UPI002617332B|nr:hypothetical protein [uncultured Tenacibaculum sp.]